MLKKNIILFFCIASLMASVTGCTAIAPKPKSTPSVSTNLNNHSNTDATTAPGWIHMFNAQTGYGASFDHPVMVTSDGGKTWIDVTPQKGVHVPNTDISGYFLNAQSGWAFRAQREKSVTVLGTHDGGYSWSQLATVPIKYGDGGVSVVFSDARHGWFEDSIASPFRGELFTTSNGGKAWRKVASYQQGNFPGGALSVQENGTLWLSGSKMRLLKSTNGGKTWSPVNLPLPATHEKVMTFISTPVFFGRNGFIPVLFQGGHWVLYASRDDGQTWIVQSTLPSAIHGANVVYNFVSNRDGWVSNNGTGVESSGKVLYVTHDAGLNWHKISTHGYLENKYIRIIDFVNSKVGWITFDFLPALKREDSQVPRRS